MACTCCTHENRADLDAAIVAGESVRSIGRRFDVSPWAVSRHHTNHMSAALVAVSADAGATLVDRIEVLIGNAETMFADAAKAGQGAQALAVLKELRSQLELLGKADGTLDTRPVVTVINLQTAPEWLAMRAVLLSALSAYPEARACVAGRLLELEAGPS
jgi:hypothetical protein